MTILFHAREPHTVPLSIARFASTKASQPFLTPHAQTSSSDDVDALSSCWRCNRAISGSGITSPWPVEDAGTSAGVKASPPCAISASPPSSTTSNSGYSSGRSPPKVSSNPPKLPKKTTTFTASRALESVKRGELISASDRRGVACLIKKRHSELVLILALCGLFKGVSAKGVSATRLVRGTLGKQRFIVAPRRRVSATDALSGPSLSPSLCATSMSIDPLLVPVMPVVGRPLASGYLQGQYHAHTRQHHAIP